MHPKYGRRIDKPRACEFITLKLLPTTSNQALYRFSICTILPLIGADDRPKTRV